MVSITSSKEYWKKKISTSSARSKSVFQTGVAKMKAFIPEKWQQRWADNSMKKPMLYAALVLTSLVGAWPYFGVMAIPLVGVCGGTLELGRRLLLKIKFMAAITATIAVGRYVQTFVKEVDKSSDHVESTKSSIAKIGIEVKAIGARVGATYARVDAVYDRVAVCTANTVATQGRIVEAIAGTELALHRIDESIQYVGSAHADIHTGTVTIDEGLQRIQSVHVQTEVTQLHVDELIVATVEQLNNNLEKDKALAGAIGQLVENLAVVNDNVDHAAHTYEQLATRHRQLQCSHRHIKAVLHHIKSSTTSMELEAQAICQSNDAIVERAKRQSALTREALARTRGVLKLGSLVQSGASASNDENRPPQNTQHKSFLKS